MENCHQKLFRVRHENLFPLQICEKGFDCDVDETTRLIQEFIPDVTVDSNVGSELSYKMDSKYSRLFQPMLKTLEDNSEQLDINGYGISQTTLEEVFLK